MAKKGQGQKIYRAVFVVEAHSVTGLRYAQEAAESVKGVKVTVHGAEHGVSVGAEHGVEHGAQVGVEYGVMLQPMLHIQPPQTIGRVDDFIDLVQRGLTDQNIDSSVEIDIEHNLFILKTSARAWNGAEHGAIDDSADVAYSGSLKILASSFFDKFWETRPRRDGHDNKRNAIRQWNARIRSGALPQEMVEGAVRYAKFIRSRGQEFTEYVMMAATFLGRDEHFREEWRVTATGARSGRRSVLAPQRYGSASTEDDVRLPK